MASSTPGMYGVGGSTGIRIYPPDVRADPNALLPSPPHGTRVDADALPCAVGFASAHSCGAPGPLGRSGHRLAAPAVLVSRILVVVVVLVPAQPVDDPFEPQGSHQLVPGLRGLGLRPDPVERRVERGAD